MNKVVYTAVFGNYDQVPKVDTLWNCDFICFTDNPKIVPNGWKVVIVELNDESPADVNRRYKMLPHRYLSEYEFSLYVDGNIRILTDPTPLFSKYLDKANIAIPKHQDRDCIFQEAILCIERGLVNKEITELQMKKYADEGFPEKYGMTENGIIFRKVNDSKIMKLMESWWVEYCNGGKRDQLSFPYLIWKNNINVLKVVEGPRISKKFFKIELHSADKKKSFLKRFARTVNQKKHLNYLYLIAAKLIAIVISSRDKLLNKNRKL